MHGDNHSTIAHFVSIIGLFVTLWNSLQHQLPSCDPHAYHFVREALKVKDPTLYYPSEIMPLLPDPGLINRCFRHVTRRLAH